MQGRKSKVSCSDNGKEKPLYDVLVFQSDSKAIMILIIVTNTIIFSSICSC